MTTLDANDGYVVLINTFKVEPDRAEELLGVLSRATEHVMLPAQRLLPEFSNASIRPLLPTLSFTRDRPSWGQAFRRASFEITSVDYDLIIQAMVRNS